jgi:hypothetical protein
MLSIRFVSSIQIRWAFHSHNFLFKNVIYFTPPDIFEVPMLATWPVHSIILELIILIIAGEKY